jgi:mannose-6-phosphate isomerase-like protein (cupin superfamily)
MRIIDVKDTKIADTPHKVDVRKLFNFEHATIVHIRLKPGEALRKHKTPVDVNFFVLEGEGIVEIGDEREMVKKDQLIFSPAKIPHLLRNESEKDFRFLVIKTPTPTSETKIL